MPQFVKELPVRGCMAYEYEFRLRETTSSRPSYTKNEPLPMQAKLPRLDHRIG